MANNYCRFLSNGVRIQSDWGRLRIAPCCFWNGEWLYLDDHMFDQKFKSLHQITSCTYCSHIGRGTQLDPKVRSFQEIPIERPDGDLIYVEVSLSIECNAACLSCNDSLSTTWVSQNKKFGIKTVHDYPDPQNDDTVIDVLFKKFDFSNTTTINFQGGDPLWKNTATTVKFLNRLINVADPSNINLIFTTNGSSIPSHELVSLIQQFKSVKWILSIDGVESKFEYLRYPLHWGSINKTLDFLTSLNLSQTFSVTMTVGALNILYTNQVLEWASNYAKSKGINIPVSLVQCWGIMGTRSMPQVLKQIVTEKYKDNRQIIDLLPKNNEKMSFHDLRIYLDKMDEFRHTDWKKVFPEIVQCVESESDK